MSILHTHTRGYTIEFLLTPSNFAKDQPGFCSAMDPTTSTIFRVYSKYLFLTYPQCILDPQYALDSLRTLLHKYEPLYIASVRELHEDGSPHLHILVQNRFRASISNPNALNLRMDTSPFTIFHPNIQAAKDCDKVRQYLTKEIDSDTNTAEWGTFVHVTTPGRKDRDSDMKQIIESSTSRDEFLSMVRCRFPFEWSVRLRDFEYTARHLFPDPIPTYTPDFPIDSLICHETIANWKHEELYSVSLESYILCTSTPSDQALSNLQWMSDYTRSHQDGTSPYTSADQQEQERLPGQDL